MFEDRDPDMSALVPGYPLVLNTAASEPTLRFYHREHEDGRLVNTTFLNAMDAIGNIQFVLAGLRELLNIPSFSFARDGLFLASYPSSSHSKDGAYLDPERVVWITGESSFASCVVARRIFQAENLACHLQLVILLCLKLLTLLLL